MASPAVAQQQARPTRPRGTLPVSVGRAPPSLHRGPDPRICDSLFRGGVFLVMVCQILRPIAIGLEASVADPTVSPDTNLEKQSFRHLELQPLTCGQGVFWGSAECHPELK